jgi:zinc protease
MASQTKPITPEEFEKQRKFLILQLLGSWESNHSLFEPIKKLIYSKMDLNFFQTYPKKLQEVTLPEVIDSAKTTLHPKDLVWLLIGDKDKILPGIQKAGFKKIVILDEDGNVKE